MTDPNSRFLPTCVSGSWTVTKFRDSLIASLKQEISMNTVRMFFYAISGTGWSEVRRDLIGWRRSRPGRSVVVYVGTDHGVTEPRALQLMEEDGICVRLMRSYQGIFHPKVVWLAGQNQNIIWVGSNNLTRNGLLNNLEFAVAVRSEFVPDDFQNWCDLIERCSTDLTSDLLTSYQRERREFEQRRADARSTNFTWSRRTEPLESRNGGATTGDLVVEIMPRETGSDGRQIQLPAEAAKEFFGLSEVGSQRTICLRRKGTSESRELTMTVFSNFTVRLSISELEYGDRPCVIVFQENDNGQVSFEIVSQCIFPVRYASLLACCNRRTRSGSRRWGIVSGITEVQK